MVQVIRSLSLTQMGNWLPSSPASVAVDLWAGSAVFVSTFKKKGSIEFCLLMVLGMDLIIYFDNFV